MPDFNINSVEHQADLEMRATFCLTVLDNIERRVISTFEDIIRVDNIKPESSHFAGRKKYDDSLKNMVLGVVGVHTVELAGLKKAINTLKDNDVIGRQYKHDIGNFLAPVVTGFEILVSETNRDVHSGDPDVEIYERLRTQINNIVSYWYRCRVALEDVALRTISEEKIPEKFIKGVDIKVLKNVLDFFSRQELQSLRRASLNVNSEYKNIDDRELDISEIDWSVLENKLNNKKIIGNDGVIGNFLVNALRNSLKDRVGSRKAKIKMDVVENELVIRIEDDGKGMEQKHLDPNLIETEPETGKEKNCFIFDKGISDTNSSGLGLTNFNTRLASGGGALYVVSKRHGGVVDDPIRYQCGGSDTEKQLVKFDNIDSGTVFEIHLKLEDKK